MPSNIATFTAADAKLQPSELGETALRLAANREGQLGRESGDYYKGAIDNVGGPIAKAVDEHNNFVEISQASAAASIMANNKQEEWNKIASDPSNLHDDTIQKKFMDESLEPALQQLQDAPETDAGRKHAVELADQMRTHFWDMTSAGMSQRASAAIKQDAVTMGSQQTNMVIRNPETLPLALQQTQAYIDAAKENHATRLSPEQIAQLDTVAKDQMNNTVKGAIMGLADKSPAAASAALASGTYMGVKLDDHLPGLEQEQLKQYIAAGKLAKEVEAQQQREQQQYKDQQVNEQTTHSIFSDMSQGKMITATTALSAKGLSPQQRADFISTSKENPGILMLPRTWLTSTEFGPGFTMTAEAMQRGEMVTPAGLTKGVQMYITNPQQAITPAGAARLQEMQDKMKTPDGAYEVQMQNQVLDSLKSQLTFGGKYMTDQKGKDIYSGMQSSFYSLWDSEIKAGKTPAQLSDPDSKDYIGNAFMTLKRSDAQAMSDVVNAKPETDFLTQLDNARQQKAITLPAVEKRVVGQTYSTARGPMVWMEGGWAQPKAKE